MASQSRANFSWGHLLPRVLHLTFLLPAGFVLLVLPLLLLLNSTPIFFFGTGSAPPVIRAGSSGVRNSGLLRGNSVPSPRRLGSGRDEVGDNDGDDDSDNDNRLRRTGDSSRGPETKPTTRRHFGEGQRTPAPPHSPFLVGLGLLLSLSAFLTVAVLALVVLATQCEVPVPLLSVFPTASSSLLVVQLLTQMGRTASEGSPVIDLSQPLLWTLPDVAEKELCICVLLVAVVYVLRRLAARSQRTELTGQVPHGLTVGAWELRAVGLLAFPLSSAAFRVLVSEGSSTAFFAAKLLAALTLGSMMTSLLFAFNFVSKVSASGDVVRVRLPATVNSAEVFTDRVCNQLLALPAAVPKPSCGALFGSWLSSASWCASPTVAVVEETEPPPVRDSLLEEAEFQRAPVWCTGMDRENFQADGEVEDEMQGRPLLKNVSGTQDRAVLNGGGSLSRTTCSHSFHTGDESNGNGNFSHLDAGSDSRGGGGKVNGSLLRGKLRHDDADVDADVDTEPQSELRQAAGGADPSHVSKKYPLSAVAASHWLKVSTSTCFEVKGRELVAGVACIPWLDCAVPAGVLKHIQEVRRPTMLQVHPGQLSGPLTGGRFSVCFDWGSCWPHRWCCEVLLKVVLGVWVSMPQDVLPFLLDFLILLTLALSAYHVTTNVAFSHLYDNIGYASAAWASTALALTRIVSTAFPGLAQLLALLSAALGLPSLLLVLLGSFGLAISTLERLESQLLHERFLFRTIQGWGVFESPTADDGDSPSSLMVGSLGGGCGMPLQGLLEGSVGEHSVEVIMPGQRRAFAIVLPAMARPRVEHTQLLPPMPARGGEPEMLPACHAKGDRARLPIPPNLLFPVPEVHENQEAARLAAARSEVAPLVALLVPGKPGLMVYRDATLNDYGLEWPELVRSYFGMQGSLLAEETERLVSEKEQQRLARRQARQRGGPAGIGGLGGDADDGQKSHSHSRRMMADSPKQVKSVPESREGLPQEEAPDREPAADTADASGGASETEKMEDKEKGEEKKEHRKSEEMEDDEPVSPLGEAAVGGSTDIALNGQSQHGAEEEDEEDEDEVLIVVEVLPAFAAEFMDERHAPPAYGG